MCLLLNDLLYKYIIYINEYIFKKIILRVIQIRFRFNGLIRNPFFTVQFRIRPVFVTIHLITTQTHQICVGFTDRIQS